jgi:uncharacterized protein (TIGR02246 family)
MMRVRSLTILFAAVASAALIGCSKPTLNPSTQGETALKNMAAAKAAISSANDEWNKAISEKDLDKCVSFYEDDAVIFAPHSPAIVGKDAIRAAWKQLFSSPKVQMSFPAATLDVARSGDLAVQRGPFQILTDAKGKVATENGRFVIVWQKQLDGSWKVMADTNADVAPAKQKAGL